MPVGDPVPGGDDPRLAAVWRILHGIPDPEIPVLSIVDLGIVRDVAWREGQLLVGITPTYSGCPATEMIQGQVRRQLAQAGYPDARVVLVLSPAWTTDWLSEAGREKLRQYGIAPPACGGETGALAGPARQVCCPRCGDARTECVSRFGSTPCKAQYRCLACLEPFDYFKCH